MSTDENKERIRSYVQAIDDHDSDDWSILDDDIVGDFVAHNPPIPGVSRSAAWSSLSSRRSWTASATARLSTVGWSCCTRAWRRDAWAPGADVFAEPTAARQRTSPSA
jgi:hypothetical protein